MSWSRAELRSVLAHAEAESGCEHAGVVITAGPAVRLTSEPLAGFVERGGPIAELIEKAGEAGGGLRHVIELDATSPESLAKPSHAWLALAPTTSRIAPHSLN